MTFATLMFTFALTASAQVAPAVPATPARPAVPAMPAVPVMPAMPGVPVDFDFDFDFPALADLPHLGEIDMAMAQTEFAMASAEPVLAMLPVEMPLESMHAGLAQAEIAFAEVGRAFGHDDMAWSEQAGAAGRDRESAAYERGRSALDQRNWDEAVELFGRVADMKGGRADAALYWKAYAQSRAGRSAEAQATIATLRSTHGQSRYLNDANALEVELKRGGGQRVSPEAQQDEDLKLLAIQGLQHSDPEQAIPLLEKILNSANGPRVKERALYVLALSNSARAREILLGIAKGGGNPDLQRRAIDYLATHTGGEGRGMLEEIYRTNSDQDVRMRVLRAYMTNGDRARLLAAAQTEQNAELRVAAIRYLGSSGGSAELGQLYAKESNPDVRIQIVRGIAMSGAADQLTQIARTEKDPAVRLQVIRAFMMVGRERTGTTLTDMYATETTAEGKRAVVQALHAQNNAEGLVAIARRENDPELKEYIVRRLSTMPKSKVALDYLMELLNK